MKKATAVILMSFFYVAGAGGGVAYGEVANQATANASGGETLLDSLGGNEMAAKNYQEEVLSNPEMSGAARAGAVSAGSNTASINQSGSFNSSNVMQTGDNNIAVHTQTGKDNELRVEQNGKNNRSYESQTGDHNRKVKIQNGTETIIDQVAP